MVHLLWQATQVLLWLTGFVLVAFGPWFLAYIGWEDQEWWGWAIVPAVVWAIIAVIAGFLWVVHEVELSEDAQHKWRGGSGSETACRYVYEWEYNATLKISERVQYTVCK